MSVLISVMGMTSLLTVTPAHAAFPGVNGLLVFGATPPIGYGQDLFSMRPDGSGLRQLTHFTPSGSNNYPAEPSVSPDSRHIVFIVNWSANAQYGSEIWIMNANGSDQHRILAGFPYDPAFTADGQHILFSDCVPYGGSCGIARIDLTGAHLTMLTPWDLTGQSDVEDSYPKESPNSRLIAFSSFNRGGLLAAVYTMRPDGSAIKRVTPASIRGYRADWAPDGRTLAFTSNYRLSASEIWTIRPNGDQMRLISHDPNYQDSGAAYSPDGDWIAFGRSNSQSWGIWIAHVDGSHAQLLYTPTGGVTWGSKN